MIGMDADPAMIAVAAKAAEIAGLPIEWRVGSSFDLADDLAPLNLVTIARAFHWMDREATLKRLDELIAPMAPSLSSTPSCTRAGQPSGTSRSRSCATRTAASTISIAGARAADWEEHPSVLLRSAFSEVERISVFEARTANLEEIVARALSFSANSPAALGAAGAPPTRRRCASACWPSRPTATSRRSSRASPSSRAGPSA